jgi:heme-degrading monooxygenase HmoA
MDEPENADAYQALLEQDVLPGIAEKAKGYGGVYVLRRDHGDLVEFVTLTLWRSLDAVRTLVGGDYEAARSLPRHGLACRGKQSS